MSREKGFGQANADVIRYAYETFRPEDEVLAKARAQAAAKGLPSIQVGAFDGLHLEVLVRMTGAKRAVEIGTLGGYSAICIARGLGAGGKLHTFELDPLHVEVARKAIAEAAPPAEIIVHEGSALERLTAIEKEGPFDVVFIDADKTNYPKYLAWAADHLRVGGVVIGDNTFGWNKIHETHSLSGRDAASIEALRLFNHTLATSSRFRATILPTEEGLTVAVKIR